MQRRRIAGFSLVELLVVVAIIGILASMAVANMLNATVRAKVAAAQESQRVMNYALEMYHVDNGDYPPAPNPFLYPTLPTQTWLLTTPVAFISQVPVDIFFSPQMFGEPGGPFGPGGEYMHYIADRTVTELWLLWSYGPDRDMEFTQVTYDPTNGTVSNGDIYRVGALP